MRRVDMEQISKQASNFESITLTSFEPPADVDLLALREGDSRARRIFLAYTVRIPWISDGRTPVSRENEACYIRVNGEKA